MTGAFLAGVRARVTSKGETDGFRTPMQKRAERVSFRLAHRVIANCLVVQNQLIREGVSPARIVQHYNGLDLATSEGSAGARTRRSARCVWFARGASASFRCHRREPAQPGERSSDVSARRGTCAQGSARRGVCDCRRRRLDEGLARARRATRHSSATSSSSAAVKMWASFCLLRISAF